MNTSIQTNMKVLLKIPKQFCEYTKKHKTNWAKTHETCYRIFHVLCSRTSNKGIHVIQLSIENTAKRHTSMSTNTNRQS